MAMGGWRNGFPIPGFNPVPLPNRPPGQFFSGLHSPFKSPVTQSHFQNPSPVPSTLYSTPTASQSPAVSPRMPSPQRFGPRQALGPNLAAEPSVAAALDRYRAQQSASAQRPVQRPPYLTNIGTSPPPPNPSNIPSSSLSRYGIKPLPDISQQLNEIISGCKRPMAKSVVDGNLHVVSSLAPQYSGGHGTSTSAACRKHFVAPQQHQFSPIKFGAPSSNSECNYGARSRGSCDFNPSYRVSHKNDGERWPATPRDRDKSYRSYW